MQRTPRGREVTAKAYEHLGKKNLRIWNIIFIKKGSQVSITRLPSFDIL